MQIKCQELVLVSQRDILNMGNLRPYAVSRIVSQTLVIVILCTTIICGEENELPSSASDVGNSSDKNESLVQENLLLNENNSYSANENASVERISNSSTETSAVKETGDVSTSNKSEVPVQQKHWTCKPFAYNHSHPNWTVIFMEEINATDLFISLNESSGCVLVFFYLKWCRFSCQMAGNINMIGFFYPKELPVIAVDVHKYPGLAAKYGIVGVPTVLLFHGKKPVSKFNGSSSMQDLHDFIKEMTGFDAHENVTIPLMNGTTGPLSTVPEQKRDIYLFLSVVFLALLCLSRVFSTEVLQSVKGKFYRTFVEPWRSKERVKED